MIKKETIKELLNKMVKEGKIQDWGFSKYSYWDNVIYIIINDEKIFLCEEIRSLSKFYLKTICDYTNEISVINCINYVIDNKQLLKNYYIYTLRDLKTVKESYGF